eukprot:c35021_g1_i1 orf=79-1038(-)
MATARLGLSNRLHCTANVLDNHIHDRRNPDLVHLTRLQRRKVQPHNSRLRPLSPVCTRNFVLAKTSAISGSNNMEDPGITLETRAVTNLNLILDIFGIIFRLPRIILDLFRSKETALNEIEEKVDKVADAVKIGANIISNVAKGVEKLAEVVEKDSEEVEESMDKIKVTTKKVHIEIDDAIATLEQSVEDAASISTSSAEETNSQKGISKQSPTAADSAEITGISPTSTLSNTNTSITSSFPSSLTRNLVGERQANRNPWRYLYVVGLWSGEKGWLVMRVAMVVGMVVVFLHHLPLVSHGLSVSELLSKVVSPQPTFIH